MKHIVAIFYQGSSYKSFNVMVNEHHFYSDLQIIVKDTVKNNKSIFSGFSFSNFWDVEGVFTISEKKVLLVKMSELEQRLFSLLKPLGLSETEDSLSAPFYYNPLSDRAPWVSEYAILGVMYKEESAITTIMDYILSSVRRGNILFSISEGKLIVPSYSGYLVWEIKDVAEFTKVIYLGGDGSV